MNIQKITFFKYRVEIGLPRNTIVHTLRSITHKYEENKQSGKDCLFAGKVDNEYFKLEYIGKKPTFILTGTIMEKETNLTISTISFRNDMFTNIGILFAVLFSLNVVIQLLFIYRNTSFLQNVIDNFRFIFLWVSLMVLPVVFMCWSIHLDKKSLFEDFEELFKEEQTVP